MSEATKDAIRKQAQQKSQSHANYEDSENTAKIDLPLVKQPNGEEGFVCLMKIKTRLYRIRDGEWKQRGTGFVKL